MAKYRNVVSEAEFVVEGTPMVLDVGGGFALKSVEEDGYKLLIKGFHGIQDQTIFVPARLIVAADEKARNEDLLLESEWPGHDEEVSGQ
jgi:hypothetical protein